MFKINIVNLTMFLVTIIKFIMAKLAMAELIMVKLINLFIMVNLLGLNQVLLI
jgi:hypothetical protein